MNHTLQEIPLRSLSVGHLANASCVPTLPTSLIPGLPDKYMVLFAPVAVYWGFSLTFHLCDYYGLLSKYKMHTPTEFLQRNKVPMRTVIRGVLIQQAFQTIAGAIFAWNDAEELVSCERRDVAAYALSIWKFLHLSLPSTNVLGMKSSQLLSISLCVHLAEIFYKAIIPTFQLILAIFFLDSWQYWLHYNMHKRRWLYRHVHSRHHLLYVPYAFGAFYNHPVEWLLGDTVASLAAFKVARMTMRQGTLLFVLATLKTVDDHSGFKLPWDPFQWVTDNNAYYHDIHHQSWGMTYNLAQPFTSFWDRVLGTRWTGSEQETQIRYDKGKVAAEKAAELKAAASTATDLKATVVKAATLESSVTESAALIATAVEASEMESIALRGAARESAKLEFCEDCLVPRSKCPCRQNHHLYNITI